MSYRLGGLDCSGLTDCCRLAGVPDLLVDSICLLRISVQNYPETDHTGS